MTNIFIGELSWKVYNGDTALKATIWATLRSRGKSTLYSVGLKNVRVSGWSYELWSHLISDR